MKISIFQIITFSGLLISNGNCLSSEISDPPKVVYKLGKTESSLTKLPDGKLMLFRMEGTNLCSMISSDGSSWSEPKVEIANHSDGKWYTLDFVWDLAGKTCKVICSGKLVLTLTQINETLNGLNYLRLRSLSPVIDTAGYFIESVVVDIDDNVAPPASEKNKQTAEANYRAKLIYDEKPDYILK